MTKSCNKCKIIFYVQYNDKYVLRICAGLSFNSIGFLFFFPAAVLFHFALPQRRRLVFLLSVGYLFYLLFTPEHLILLLGTTVTDYFIALKMAEYPVVSVAWVFFRARTVSDAFYIITNMFSGLCNSIKEIIGFIANIDLTSLAGFLVRRELGLSYFMMLVVGLAMMVMETVHVLQKDLDSPYLLLKGKSVPLKWTQYFAFIFWVLLFGRFEAQTFIYLQF